MEFSEEKVEGEVSVFYKQKGEEKKETKDFSPDLLGDE